MKGNRRGELINSILRALRMEGITCTESIKSTKEIPSFHLISFADSTHGEFFLKMRAIDDVIKFSLQNSDYLFELDLERNVVRYHSRSKKIDKIISIFKKYNLVGPKMSCFQYAGYLFLQKHKNWTARIDNKINHSVYVDTITNTLLIIEPLFIEFKTSDKKSVPPQRRIRIAYYRQIQDGFWFSTYSQTLDDILFFLDEYKELNEILQPLHPWSINGMFHPIL